MYEGDKLMAEVVDKMDELKKQFNEDLFYDKEALLRKDNYDDGLKEGIKQTKMETAKNLLKMNMDIKDIAKAVGMLAKDIEELRKDI